MATETREKALLLHCLDAFGDDAQIERPTQCHNGRHDCRIVGIRHEIAHEAAVDPKVAQPFGENRGEDGRLDAALQVLRDPSHTRRAKGIACASLVPYAAAKITQ
jgi:hypothetical protein